MRFLSLLLMGLGACVVLESCDRPWSVCEAQCGCGGYSDCDACTVLHVCMLREYEGVKMTAMLVWGMGDVCLR